MDLRPAVERETAWEEHGTSCGYLNEAFHVERHGKDIGDPLSMLTPAHFLSTPGLWIGFVVAVGFLAGAIWLRRSREAI